MIFGLIGKHLGHSFSADYFTRKFANLNLSHQYNLFELNDISEFNQLKSTPNLIGLNVTIPYKTAVIPFLDELDESAAKIGAVNTILFQLGKARGYNTDVVGFEKSMLNWYPVKQPKSALVLGFGGAARAVMAGLEKHFFEYKVVSRRPNKQHIGYEDIDANLIQEFPLIIQTTPVGMFPNQEVLPLPYSVLSDQNYFFDLIYNPSKTATALLLETKGVYCKNGLEMLYLQAEKSWDIWQSLDSL